MIDTVVGIYEKRPPKRSSEWLFGITEHVNYPEIPDGWITTMQISTLDKYQKLIPSNSGELK